MVFAQLGGGAVGQLEAGELYAGLCGGTRPVSAASIPAIFGAGRPPEPSLVESPLSSTAPNGAVLAWLVPIGGALLAVGPPR
ncbi:MAG: hypothetical protein ACR2HP_04050 [Ilumatobacteraceae bacterium]